MKSTSSLIRSRHPKCPEKLTDAQITEYWDKGFIVFENALSPSEIEEAKTAMREMIDRYVLNRELGEYKTSGSKKKNNQSGATFYSKTSSTFVQLEPGYEPNFDNPDEIENKVRKFMNFSDEAPIFRKIYQNHPRIQGVIRSLIGSEIELYQSMALLKPSYVGCEKPWHQDNAYFSVKDMDGILGSWIALDDATVANGCMHFIEGGHKLGPLRHHHTSDCEIIEGRIDPSTAIPVELKAGGIILFHGNIPHETPSNTSPDRRRAIQYHYRRNDNEIISREAFDSVFKEADGTPASCDAARRENF